MAVAAVIGFFLAGSRAGAEPAACPARILTCCDLTAIASPRPDRRLRLGVHVWTEDVRDHGAKLSELAPRALRYSGGPNWRRTRRLALDMSYDELRGYVAAAFDLESERFRSQSASMLALVEGSGAEAHFVVWEPPMTEAEPVERNDRETGQGKPARGRQLPDAAVAVTALFYVALIDELKRRGYPVDTIELSSEPDGHWNIQISLRRYVRLVAEVRRQAALHGVKLGLIAGPGLSNIAALRSYLADPALAAELIRVVDRVSVHAWDDRVRRDPVDEARSLRRKLDRLGYREPVIASEFAITFLDPPGRDGAAGAQSRTANSPSNQTVYAAKTMAQALGLASAGFGPIVYWEFRDQPWGKGSYGLFDLQGAARPTVRLWQELAPIIRRHADAGVVSLDADSAFALVADTSLVALVLLNPSREPWGVVLSAEVKSRLGERPGTLPMITLPCAGETEAVMLLEAGAAAVLLAR